MLPYVGPPMSFRSSVIVYSIACAFAVSVTSLAGTINELNAFVPDSAVSVLSTVFVHVLPSRRYPVPTAVTSPTIVCSYFRLSVCGKLL